MNRKQRRAKRNKRGSTDNRLEGNGIHDHAAKLREFYDSRRRHDRYEPSWAHPCFESAVEDPHPKTTADMRDLLRSIARSPQLVTRMLGGRHVQEDGFLVGTTSWIFMGRAACSPVEYRGWFIIDRELSDAVTALERENGLGRGHPTRFFMAYSNEHRVGASAMTGDEIGPCFSLAEVKASIDEISDDSQSYQPNDADRVGPVVGQGIAEIDDLDALLLQNRAEVESIWEDLRAQGLLHDSIIVVTPDGRIGAGMRSITAQNMRGDPEAPPGLADKLSGHPPEGLGFVWVVIFERFDFERHGDGATGQVHLRSFGFPVHEIDVPELAEVGTGKTVTSVGWGMGKRGGIVIRGDN